VQAELPASIWPWSQKQKKKKQPKKNPKPTTKKKKNTKNTGLGDLPVDLLRAP